MGSVHKCQWEKIDMSLLGCTTCSAIHVCSIDTCPSIQSQDATVCLLSGLCLTNTNFVQEQYSDRVAPYIFCVSNVSNRTGQRAITPEQIHEMATHVLLSKEARTAFHIEVRRRAQRMTNTLGSLLEKRAASTGTNAIALLEEVQKDFMHQNKLMCSFNTELRQIE